LFKQRKYKKFSYKPRHQKEKDFGVNENLESKWSEELKTAHRSRGSKLTSFPKLIVLLIMVLILLYVLNTYID